MTSSLQHNIPRSFCLVLVFWNLLPKTFYSVTSSFCKHTKSSFGGYVIETKEHCVRDKNKSKRTKPTHFKRSPSLQLWRSMKNEKSSVIGSRIRERDKKNEEYYVGDYYLKFKCLINFCKIDQKEEQLFFNISYFNFHDCFNDL